MNTILERLDLIWDSLSEEERKLYTDSRFPYIITKAHLYLRIGPDKYRNQDFFHMPDQEWNDDELELIADGCRQILEGRGFDAGKPLTGLGVEGFSKLFHLFHFEIIGRETSSPGTGKFLDKMIFRHVMEGGEVTWYNLVEYDYRDMNSPFRLRSI